jgi:hypothetical protein
MILTDIERNVIEQLKKDGYSSNKLTPETDLINDLKLTEKDIYNIGWRLNIVCETDIPMPEKLPNARIKQIATYFIEHTDNAI